MSSSESEWEPVEWTDEELYYDFSTGMPFDDVSKRIIDGIANDPRFDRWSESTAVVTEWAGHVDVVRRALLEEAARGVYSARVHPRILKQASEVIRRALQDPNFELLPLWSNEPVPADYFATLHPPLDHVVLVAVTRSIPQDPRFLVAEGDARLKVEADAAALAESLPQASRDFLFFSTRNTEREDLVRKLISESSPRRLSWTAYYVQRFVREQDEESTQDRYSIAAKQLILSGQSKAEVKRSLGVSVNRLEQLLRRPASGYLEETDPLVSAFPAIRDASSAPPEMPMEHSPSRAKSIAQMYVTDLVELVDHTTDPDVLHRIVRRKSASVAEALFRRHIRAGDLGDEVLGQLPEQFPNQHHYMLVAHKERPLPPRTAMTLADAEPVAVLDFSDETVASFDAGGRERQEVALALRTGNLELLEGVLQLPEKDPLFEFLVEMLAARPMRNTLCEEPSFANALVRKAEQVLDAKVAATLRVVACQSPAELSKNLERARETGDLGIDPTAFVHAALGGYHERGDGSQDFLHGIAQQLWSAADLTVEHSLARATLERAGTDRAVICTPDITYVATPDAIRAYRNSDEKVYTYVHLHLTAAKERHLDGLVIVLPTSMPALSYGRERGTHPLAPDGPEVEVIVWKVPLQPAIYSLDTGLNSSAGFFAYADGKVAVVEDL